MNKKLSEIIDGLLLAVSADPVLSARLTSTSKTAVWRQMLEVVGFAIWNFQEAARAYYSDVAELIRTQKVPSLRWYRDEAMRFQFGFPMYTEQIVFDNTGYTEDEIAASKIIKYCSATRSLVNNRYVIVLKIGTENAGEIVPVEPAQELAFAEYVEEFAPAGDYVVTVNFLPDLLRLNLRIFVDPLQIDSATGMHFLGGNYPVEDAIRAFLKNLPFNGELSIQRLEEAILAVPGVEDLKRISVESAWIDPATTGYGAFQPVQVVKIPRSGHFKIDNFAGISYGVKEPEV